MAGARLKKTRYPGIYRRGKRVVYEWVDAAGERRRATVDTIDQARSEKAKREEEANRGVPDEDRRPDLHGLTLGAYARDLFGANLDRPADQKPARGRYQGRRGGIRPRTLDTYRRDLENHVLPALGSYRLDALKAPHIKRFLADLAAREGAHYLRDKTLRAIFAPLRAMLTEAVEEGLIDHNPAASVRVPSGRDVIRDVNASTGDHDDDGEDVRALTRVEMAAFLAAVTDEWRILFEFLAVTGLRISEAAALRWKRVVLTGDRPHVRIRVTYVPPHFGPPKSKHGKRSVPIPVELAERLAALRSASAYGDDNDFVFPSTVGTPIDADNLRTRVLKPASENSGVGWDGFGFHSFRHTCASMLIADGRNIVQVSRWLGHHSPAFTLERYGHLLDEGVGEALPLPAVGVGGVSAM